MNQEFRRLSIRLNRRLAHAADVLSIFTIDGCVVAAAYAIVRLVGHFSRSGSKAFEMARAVSEAYFLIIYLIWVGFDLTEFFIQLYRAVSDVDRG